MCQNEYETIDELLMDNYFFQEYIKFWLEMLHAELDKKITGVT